MVSAAVTDRRTQLDESRSRLSNDERVKLALWIAAMDTPIEARIEQVETWFARYEYIIERRIALGVAA